MVMPGAGEPSSSYARKRRTEAARPPPDQFRPGSGGRCPSASVAAFAGIRIQRIQLDLDGEEAFA